MASQHSGPGRGSMKTKDAAVAKILEISRKQSEKQIDATEECQAIIAQSVSRLLSMANGLGEVRMTTSLQSVARVVQDMAMSRAKEVRALWIDEEGADNATAIAIGGQRLWEAPFQAVNLSYSRCRGAEYDHHDALEGYIDGALFQRAEAAIIVVDDEFSNAGIPLDAIFKITVLRDDIIPLVILRTKNPMKLVQNCLYDQKQQEVHKNFTAVFLQQDDDKCGALFLPSAHAHFFDKYLPQHEPGQASAWQDFFAKVDAESTTSRFKEEQKIHYIETAAQRLYPLIEPVSLPAAQGAVPRGVALLVRDRNGRCLDRSASKALRDQLGLNIISVVLLSDARHAALMIIPNDTTSETHIDTFFFQLARLLRDIPAFKDSTISNEKKKKHPPFVAIDTLTCSMDPLNQSRVDVIASAAADSGYFIRPLRVRRDDLEVLDGRHHLAAARALGLRAVPVSFFDDDATHFKQPDDRASDNDHSLFFPDSVVWRALARPLLPCTVPLEKLRVVPPTTSTFSFFSRRR